MVTVLLSFMKLHVNIYKDATCVRALKKGSKVSIWFNTVLSSSSIMLTEGLVIRDCKEPSLLQTECKLLRDTSLPRKLPLNEDANNVRIGEGY